jgi:hypothetical protein
MTVSATSSGGDGGQGVGGGFAGGQGGNAIAQATANAGDVIATATGGNGGTGSNSATFGIAGTASATATSHGVTVTDFIASGVNAQTGGQAESEVTWTSAGGATVIIGTGGHIDDRGVNNGQGVVTGPLAYITGVSGTGSLTIGDGVNASVLQMNYDAGGSSQSALIIEAGSTFDLNDNHFFINYGSNADPLATLKGYIKSGYNGGAWNGPGIISSAAQTKTNGLRYGIGYADSADPGNPAGLSSGQIELKYTLLGDANLDGIVNAADFTILAANFNQTVTGWDQGDFNYDGIVNAADFTDLAANFNQSASGAASAGDVAALDAFVAANGISLANVPEPASLGLSTFGAVSILARRRRHKRL